jgi:hypothetical protein
MAKLPTRDNLSGPVSLRSGRAIASVDTTAIGRGISAAGDALSTMGADITQRQNTVDIARAEAYKTENLLKVQNEFDVDGDYSTFQKRAPTKTGEVVKTAANLIRDPRMRERWSLSAASDAARYNDSIFDRGTALGRQAETNALDEALETNRRLYVDPATGEDVKRKARADIEATLETAGAAGLLTPDQVAARKKMFVEDADFSRGQLAVQTDPGVIVGPLPAKVADRSSAAIRYFQSRGWSKEQAAGIVGNLLAESKLNTGARNPGDGRDGTDSIGIAQWNSGRARALKKFAADNKADWQDYGVQLAFVDHELRTSEKAAGDALRKARNLDEATAAFIGYERPAGWSAANPRGGHNYSGRLKFAAQAAGEKVNPEWYDRLSPERQFALQKQAESEQNKRNIETRAQIEVVTTNAPTAILNTGQYDNPLPTAQQFMDAYGPMDGAQRFNAFQSQVLTASQAHDMRTMSAEDIQKMVSDATPTSTGDNAALETQRFQTLSAAAQSTFKAREEDPGRYVRQTFPNIKQAWDNVSTGDDYQAALALTAAAQRNLGISNMRLLPDDHATAAVDKFKDTTLPEGKRLETAMHLVMSTQDREQQRAVFNQLVEAGLPDMTEGAFEAMARGDNGAAKRLFQAALINPDELPGALSEKKVTIADAIQTELMDEGEVGEVYYGLTDGNVENFARAERDNKLMMNAVILRMKNGEALNAAISGVSRDLYGDVKVVDGDRRVNTRLLLPQDQDERVVLDGLNAVMPNVRTAVEAALALPEDLATADSTKPILDAMTQNYAENVLSEGYFRNYGDGFVFHDPYTGKPVPGPDGMPLVFTVDMLAAAPRPPAPNTEEIERQFMEDRARQFGIMGGSQ